MLVCRVKGKRKSGQLFREYGDQIVRSIVKYHFHSVMLVMSYGYCSSLKLALPYLYVCVIDFGHSDIDKYDIPVFSHS